MSLPGPQVVASLREAIFLPASRSEAATSDAAAAGTIPMGTPSRPEQGKEKAMARLNRETGMGKEKAMRTASVRMAWRMAALVGALCLAALVPPATAVPVAPPVPTTGWLLDEGAGLTLSQYRGLRTGTMGGPVLPPQWSADVPLAYPGNWSLQFAPTGTGAPSNWCELQGHSSGSKGTVAFWVKDTDGGAPHYVLDASDPSRTLMYSTGPTTLNLYVNQTDLGSVNRSLIPGPGSGSPWTHVAIVWDNALATDKVKFYRNGVPQTSDFKNVNVGTVNPAYVYLGSRLNATEGWGGRLDEYALWNAALTADQIEWLAGHSLRQIPTRAPALPAAPSRGRSSAASMAPSTPTSPAPRAPPSSTRRRTGRCSMMARSPTAWSSPAGPRARPAPCPSGPTETPGPSTSSTPAARGPSSTAASTCS
jgi:hypothetical protein